MKKVKFIKAIRVSPFDEKFKLPHYNSGEVHEFTNDTADSMVSLGYAVLVDEPKPKIKAEDIVDRSITADTIKAGTVTADNIEVDKPKTKPRGRPRKKAE